MARVKRGFGAGIRTMWWMAALCAAIYAVMVFVGRDHGQQRAGLAGVAAEPKPMAVVEVGAAPPVGEVKAADVKPPAPPTSGAPQPLSVTAEAAVAKAAAASATGVVTITPQDLLKPGQSLGQMLVVTGRGAVVREGPGIQYKLVARLMQGTPAQEVVLPQQLVGWMVIQFDDQGQRKQGYVAAKLMGKG